MPTAISTTLPPKRNTFTFFEVSPRSFHQVAEVLGHSKRVSLHGWFHGPSLWTVSNNTVQSIEKISPVHIEEELVYQWINPVYFNPQQVNKIRRRFCRSSEIQLTNFIKVDKWKELVQCLDGIPANNWFHCGPANRRNYDCLSVSEDIDKFTPDLCRQIVRLFKSEAMLVILSDLTGIQLHPCGLISESGKTGVDEDIASKAVELAPESKRMRTDNHLNNLTTTDDDCPTYLTEPCLRKFHKGSYTLLSDVDMLNQGWRVECILHIHGYCGSGHGGDYDLVCQDSKIEDCSRINSRSAWNSSWGGQMVYVTDGETDELLTVTPSDNALTLVYVDSCTTSFLKYIKKTAGESSVEKLSDEEGNLDNLPSVVEPSHLSENHIDKESVRFYDLFVKYFESRSDLEEDVNSQNCALGEDDDVISNNSADDDGSSLSPSEDDDDDDDDDEEEEEKGEQEEVDLT
ncbi:unnamed protein product [Heterobilharzia americana]|nr:unnamed protein product [Heterobilharzia americana]